jgi:ABC-type dipeptide/oligopeptide/nickel transport system permease component
MLRTIISRLIQGIVVVFCLLLITFMLVRLMPGDPFSGDKAHAPHIIQKNKERFHLDKSNSEQFVVYLGLLARGDLGDSPVKEHSPFLSGFSYSGHRRNELRHPDRYSCRYSIGLEEKLLH